MSLYEKLFPWQKGLVDKFKDRQSYGLFLDMGLGKTLISLAFAEVNQCSKVIVITLNAKVHETIHTPGSWYEWAAKSSIGWEQFKKDERSDEYKRGVPQMIVCNYESLFARQKKTDETMRKKSKPDLKEYLKKFMAACYNENVAIIVDESHKVKNKGSAQGASVAMLKKGLDKIAKECHLYLLSGTPFTTGYMDLYNQLNLLGCDWTKGRFKDEFCVMGMVGGLMAWQQPIVGYKNIPELYNLVHKYAVTIKSEEMIDLPPQIFVKHVLPKSDAFTKYMSPKMRGIDINAELAFRGELTIPEYETPTKVNNPFCRNIAYPSLDWFADTPGNFWLRARQLTTGFQGNAEKAIWFDKDRLAALKAFLSENRDNYVLFYNYVPELVELYDICTELKYDVDVYAGEIKSLDNYERYSEKLKRGEIPESNNIILANFVSGSTGMNWQNYSHCIMFSLPIYKDYAQGLKRVHRVGQKETVFYHIFLQDNWLDKSMMESLEQKTDYTEDMFKADLKRITEIKEI